jgi:peptidoglycan/xylan/chitin deacetylase (PgdA/CDA1 family)
MFSRHSTGGEVAHSGERYLFGMTRVTGHAALTFDGGPHPDDTPKLLALLDRLGGVRATVFLLGLAAERHPAIAGAIAGAGHEIAVLGFRLPDVRGELAQAVTSINAATGIVPYWCRPHRDAREMGLRTVRPTCPGRDDLPDATADSVYRSVLRKLDSRGTILLHDSDYAAAPKCWLSMLGALPAILTTCRARSLDVGPLREHGL